MLTKLQLFFQGDSKSQNMAAWAVTNLTLGGTITQIIALFRKGVVKPMCKLIAELGGHHDEVLLL
jgi:hypothetical protein